MVTLASWSVGWQRLRDQIRVIWLQDRWVVWLWSAGVVLNLIAYALFGIGITPGGDTVVLHYSVYFGIDLVGPWYQLYSVPLIGTFIWCLNGGLIVPLYRREALFGYALAGTTLISQLFITLTAALLLWVNG